ncbi:MAG TPA: VOC family protein [Acidimicrobiales bacterium]|jgi:hypothetical protein|nr:VOC family protein [Acidimicrobiales bacterium]
MIRLRQIALVAHDLDAVVHALSQAFGLDVAFRDPSVATFGLVNAVLPVGDQFLEVVSPTRSGTAAGRQLERMGGDGGYMVICHTDDQAPFRARADRLGVRSALEHDEDNGYRIWQLHPGDTGGSFLEIDYQPGWDEEPKPWIPAGPDWHRAVRTDVIDGFAAVELAVPDVDRTAARWRDLIGQSDFDNAGLRWAGGTGGIITVDVRGVDRARAGTSHNICGVEFRLV